MRRFFIYTYIFCLGLLLFVQFVFAPLVSKVIEKHYLSDVVEYNRKLSRGVFALMERELLRHPESSWPAQIDAMRSDFGYQIELLGLNSVDLDSKHRGELLDKEIVVIEQGDYHFYRIGDSNYVIKKGPFSTLEPKETSALVIVWGTLLISIAVLAGVVVVPIWKQLRIIGGAASRFGAGDLSTRAQLPRHSAYYTLAGDFNSMAARIQQLINSHKELTNAVAHELRTPLARMRFSLEMLGEAHDPEEKERFMDELGLDVTELETMVEELLTLARMDREKPQLSLERHDLAPFLEEVLFLARQLDSGRDCTLHCELAEDFSPPTFDAKYLARAITNLLQNGYIHAKNCVALVAEAEGGDLLLHVDDDGPGIEEEHREKIFEPFTRLDSSRSRESGGYGLGLTIVAKIILWHQGTISVTKSPLGGARFTIRLPQKP